MACPASSVYNPVKDEICAGWSDGRSRTALGVMSLSAPMILSSPARPRKTTTRASTCRHVPSLWRIRTERQSQPVRLLTAFMRSWTMARSLG